MRKKKKKQEKPKKFKWGRLRKGDIATRIMHEGEGAELEIWKNKCIIFKITKKFIICEIFMAHRHSHKDELQQIIFDKKTGINIRGEDFGWLENPKKPKRGKVAV